MAAAALTVVPTGLLAGLAGTAVMTAGQTVEMRLTGREASTDPAKAVENLTGEEPRDAQGEQALSTAAHFAYGTVLGLTLGLLRDVKEPARTGAFFVGAWGLGVLIETWLHPDQPPPKWNAQQLATDIGHHLVYAVTAAYAYRKLDAAFTAR